MQVQQAHVELQQQTLAGNNTDAECTPRTGTAEDVELLVEQQGALAEEVSKAQLTGSALH